MSTKEMLITALRAGNVLREHDYHEEDIHEAARNLRLRLIAIDCQGVEDQASLLETIARQLDFPDYFGGNLDAFYDCLTDYFLDLPEQAGFVVILKNLKNPQRRQQFFAVFQDISEFLKQNALSLTTMVMP